MRKANIADTPRETWQSPSGKFKRWSKELNTMVGGDSESMDLTKRWPFDVALYGVPPGAARCPYHSHANQWEFYLIISGRGIVRHAGGEEEVGRAITLSSGPSNRTRLLTGGTRNLFTIASPIILSATTFFIPTRES